MKFADNSPSTGRSGFELVLAALDRMIADGDREIARLKELLENGRALSARDPPPIVASDELRLLSFVERKGQRQPDIILPDSEAEPTARRRAA